MRQIITGSIATDHLMTFPGRFTDQFVEGKLDKVSLSFLVDKLKIHRGGIAANVAFGMARLGLKPILVGSVGEDFGEYRQWLEAHKVDTRYVRVSDHLHTARGLGPEGAARLGCALAALVMETSGTQEYLFEPGEFLGRLGKSYGRAVAADLAACLEMPSALPRKESA